SVLCLFLYAATAPPAIFSLSLHDALPIFANVESRRDCIRLSFDTGGLRGILLPFDDAAPQRPGPELLSFLQGRQKFRPRTLRCRSEEHTLNSSHVKISYAVFCLKKKNTEP